MCGLITILDWRAGGWGTQKEAEKGVNRGLKQMAYRGLPDRWHTEIIKRTILGHVRLPLVNLSSTADQPMLVENTFVTFTGEIFNWGIQPTASSDTEALGLHFREHGVDGFHDLDGFWAATFVDYDRVTVVTDYLGQKPLYFHEDSLTVASEPWAIVKALDRPLLLDPVYFSNVLKWGYDPTGRTPWQGIVQLPPGYELVWKNGRLKRSTYWDWEKVPFRSSLRDLVTRAVANRVSCDREVGVLLSGGLDSTIVYKILTQVLGHDLRVFHTANGEDEYLQAALDGHSATLLPTPEVTIRQGVIAHQVPVDLGSMVPQLALAKALKGEGLHVAFSGDGADELFGGYRRAQEYDSQGSDVFVELPYYHLPRLDRLMMAETVELRSPFLAPQVIRHALQIPWQSRRKKEPLKYAFWNLVPEEILNREKKALKTSAVIDGGLIYREQLINLWKEEFT